MLGIRSIFMDLVLVYGPGPYLWIQSLFMDPVLIYGSGPYLWIRFLFMDPVLVYGSDSDHVTLQILFRIILVGILFNDQNLSHDRQKGEYYALKSFKHVRQCSLRR